jgi:DNA-binding CsgD family transcriptional regulator
MAAAEPAADAELLRVGGRVEFAHPLVRSAAYRAAPVEDRYRVHRALADATDAAADPDRRAWHRARGTAGPDEDVAAELEHSAGRAESRGGLAAAAAFLTRATELTPAPAARVRRALDAAFADVRAGAFDAAGAMVTIARDGPMDEWQRARIDLVRAELAFASSRGNEATPLLLAAARRLEPLDLELARTTYLDAFSAAQFAGRLANGVTVTNVARAARSLPHRVKTDPTTGDLLLAAFTALTGDYDTAVAACRRAVQRLRGDRNAGRDRLRWLWQGAVLALELWDDRAAYLLSRRHLHIARRTGSLAELPLALSSRTPILVFCGELSGAAALVEEARSVLEATGVDEAPYGALTLEAWQGRTREASDLIEATMREATARGEGIGVATTQYARAVLCNGLGRYEEALAAAREACADPHELVAHNWGLAELIESATRAGREDLATDALHRLAGKARASGTDWALGMAARSQALLSRGGEAEVRYREAIERLGRTRIRAELGRAHLLYGEWLRRANRRADARGALGTAYEMFSGMGMAGFAERSRRELLATGATVRRRNADTRDELTAQEAQIARLARDGLSNPEIGSQLFISARTVEWHLRKVFTKLGISSRRQLRGIPLR